jgi:hypothetical protein
MQIYLSGESMTAFQGKVGHSFRQEIAFSFYLLMRKSMVVLRDQRPTPTKDVERRQSRSGAQICQENSRDEKGDYFQQHPDELIW